MTNLRSFFTASAALTLIHGATAGVARRWGLPAGPFCTDFTPFTYAGCFAEGVSARALPFVSDISTDNMTIQTCVSFCKGNNYRYAGLEYYGECFCGASVAGVQLNDSMCNFPCTGNQTQACGGNSILSVYQDPTFPAINLTTISDYQSSGCYTDDGNNGRTLVYRQDSLNSSTLTVNNCLSSCKNAGYPLAGVEFGSECYCGVVLGNGTQQVATSQCNMPCNGNPNQICGGPALLNLYVATDLESSQPCNFNPVLPSTSSSQSSTTSSKTSTSSSLSITTTTSTSTKTTSAALCTKTIQPTCEYSCGSWCSSPLPPFTSTSDCNTAASQCLVQISDCFANSKYPDSLQCYEFTNWCKNVASYCSSTCAWGKCSKDDCKSKYPPPPPPSTPSVSVYTCPVTTTTTAKATTSTTCSSVPIPTPSNICVQANNPAKGYSTNSPCGGIALPCLTCNNIKSDFDSGLPFKLYTSKDTSKCGAYKKSGISQACSDACLAQYNTCIGTYAESCKNNNRSKRDGFWQWGNWYNSNSQDTYSTAQSKCKNQYNDCLAANSQATAGNRCGSWNSGWS